MMIRFVLMLSTVVLASCDRNQSHSESEVVTQRFALALNEFSTDEMIKEMHSDALDFFKQFLVRMASTTQAPEELREMLVTLEVESVEELRALDSRTATKRFYDFSFGRMSPQVRDIASQSQVTIIGSLQDRDNIYVLYRTDMSVDGFDASIPSVVVLRTENGKLKVLNTTQMEAVKAKLYAQKRQM